ncbi:MAG: exodeoxyribonuclease VII small subunit [Thermodesulfobacteriota bacterium]|nr:exodeoxyribonuclease VII small subunit [Thermodesulfobacteriota bacterium]
MKKNAKYSETLKDLEDMVAQMDAGNIPVDELGEAVKKASSMIKFLREKLVSTQNSVREILKELDQEDPGEGNS